MQFLILKGFFFHSSLLLHPVYIFLSSHSLSCSITYVPKYTKAVLQLGSGAWRFGLAAGAVLVPVGWSCQPRAWQFCGCCAIRTLSLAVGLLCGVAEMTSGCGLTATPRSCGWLLLLGCHLCCIASTNVQLCRAYGGMLRHFAFTGFVCKLLLVGLIYARVSKKRGGWGVRWSPFCFILASSGVR